MPLLTKGDVTLDLKATYLPPSVGGGANRVKLAVTAWRTSTGTLMLFAGVTALDVVLWVDGGAGNPGTVIATFALGDFHSPTGAHLDEGMFATQNSVGGAGQDTVLATINFTGNDGAAYAHQDVVHIPWSF